REALGVRTLPRVALSLHHRFPTRLERVMFSTRVSIGRAKAKATASATCAALIMRSRGHLPSTWLQMSVSVAAGLKVVNPTFASPHPFPHPPREPSKSYV